MSRIKIEVFSSPVRGKDKKVAESTVSEEDAHDELRDLLHAAGVERPERAILEGGPVWDTPTINQIYWKIEEVE